MSSSRYEKLTIYGFSFDYPTVCKLEFNPKFRREAGDMAVKWPENYNIFVSWGPLESLKKKGTTLEDHAKFSMERIRKSVQGKVAGMEHREEVVQGHRSVFNHVKVEVPKRGLFGGKPHFQEIRSLHIHCDQTSRYFVIYGSTELEKSDQQAETVASVISSFRCH